MFSSPTSLCQQAASGETDRRQHGLFDGSFAEFSDPDENVWVLQEVGHA